MPLRRLRYLDRHTLGIVDDGAGEVLEHRTGCPACHAIAGILVKPGSAVAPGTFRDGLVRFLEVVGFVEVFSIVDLVVELVL